MKGIACYEYVTLLLVILVNPATSFFEYGAHQMGEVESLRYKGKIPPFHSEITVNITHDRADLQNRYTYLSVVTKGTFVISNPIIVFDPITNRLTIHIKFPLLPMKFFANGFSLPKHSLRFGPILPVRVNDNPDQPAKSLQEKSNVNLSLKISHFCWMCSECCKYL